LSDNAYKGVRCPCCDQLVKIYRRKLNSGMAITLIRMYLYDPHEWMVVKDFLRRYSYHNNHDWTLLKNWCLIEGCERDPEHGGRTIGAWRITPLGRMFVKNTIKVHKYVVIYNKRFQRLEGEMVDIRECLGSKFNYYELMKGV